MLKNLSFEERAKLFREAVIKAEKKYGVEIVAGYIDSCDDDNNLIIQEIKKYKDNSYEIINEVYFDTLKKGVMNTNE